MLRCPKYNIYCDIILYSNQGHFQLTFLIKPTMYIDCLPNLWFNMAIPNNLNEKVLCNYYIWWRRAPKQRQGLLNLGFWNVSNLAVKQLLLSRLSVRVNLNIQITFLITMFNLDFTDYNHFVWRLETSLCNTIVIFEVPLLTFVYTF